MHDAGMWKRVVWLDQEIQAGRCPSIEKIRKKFEVSERTAHGTRRFLQYSLGAPLQYSRSKGGYVYTEPTYVLPSLFLAETDARALEIARVVADRFAGAALARGIAVAVEKLRERAGSSFGEGLHVAGQPPPEAAAGLVEALITACQQRRVARFTYYTARRQSTEERVVEPHVVSNLLGSWRVIGWDRARGAVRVFAVSRMSRLCVTEEQFEERAVVQEALEASLFGDVGGPPQDVVIRASAWQAPWIRERVLHPSQRVEDEADGGVLLRLRVSVTNDLVRWVLSHGGNLRVIQPTDLRERVAEGARRLVEASLHELSE